MCAHDQGCLLCRLAFALPDHPRSEGVDDQAWNMDASPDSVIPRDDTADQATWTRGVYSVD